MKSWRKTPLGARWWRAHRINWRATLTELPGTTKPELDPQNMILLYTCISMVKMVNMKTGGNAHFVLPGVEWHSGYSRSSSEHGEEERCGDAGFSVDECRHADDRHTHRLLVVLLQDGVTLRTALLQHLQQQQQLWRHKEWQYSDVDERTCSLKSFTLLLVRFVVAVLTLDLLAPPFKRPRLLTKTHTKYKGMFNCLDKMQNDATEKHLVWLAREVTDDDSNSVNCLTTSTVVNPVRRWRCPMPWLSTDELSPERISEPFFNLKQLHNEYWCSFSPEQWRRSLALPSPPSDSVDSFSNKNKGLKGTENDANGNGFSFHSLHRVEFLRTFKTAFRRCTKFSLDM